MAPTLQQLQDRLAQVDAETAALAAERISLTAAIDRARHAKAKELRDQLARLERQSSDVKAQLDALDAAAPLPSSQQSNTSHHTIPLTPPEESVRAGPPTQQRHELESPAELKLGDFFHLGSDEYEHNSIDPRQLDDRHRALSPSPEPTFLRGRAASTWPQARPVPVSSSTPIKRPVISASEQPSSKRRQSARASKRQEPRCVECTNSLHPESQEFGRLITCAVVDCGAHYCAKHIGGANTSGIRTCPLVPICRRHPQYRPSAKTAATHPDFFPRLTYDDAASIVEHYPIIERIVGDAMLGPHGTKVLDMIGDRRHLIDSRDIVVEAGPPRIVTFEILGTEEQGHATDRYLRLAAPLLYARFAKEYLVPRRQDFRCDACNSNPQILEQCILRCQAPGCAHTLCAKCAKVCRNPVSWLCALHRVDAAIEGFSPHEWKLQALPQLVVEDITRVIEYADAVTDEDADGTIIGYILRADETAEVESVATLGGVKLYDCTLLGFQPRPASTIDAIITHARLMRDCPNRLKSFLRSNDRTLSNRIWGVDAPTMAGLEFKR